MFGVELICDLSIKIFNILTIYVATYLLASNKIMLLLTHQNQFQLRDTNNVTDTLAENWACCNETERNLKNHCQYFIST